MARQPTSGETRIVEQVRKAIKRDFDGLLSMDDYAKKDPAERERAFLSRGVAALVARDVLDCDNASAAGTVIDGRDDCGIDAVAVAKAAPHVWLIQAKWADKGNAGFGVGEALKFIDGLRQIDSRQYERFNDRFTSLAEQVNVVLDQPQARVTLVVAMLGPGPLAEPVARQFEDAKADFNAGVGEFLDYEVRDASAVWRIVHDDLEPPPIELAVNMRESIQLTLPYAAQLGTVAALDVADWFEEHGERLFMQNIRTSLGLTGVNQELINTLTTEPDAFWYLNNGITVIAETVEITPLMRGPRGLASVPIRLDLKGASVVNGAQTVAAIHAASRQSQDTFAAAQVNVKVIATRGTPEGFGKLITEATNTQNRVEARDFIALDPVQREIQEDFALDDLTYVFKRGDMDPAPDAGCSVVQAATALACAHGDPRVAVRVKANPNVLWDRSSQGLYKRLFGERPDPVQLWRSVTLLRAVGAAVHRDKSRYKGRAAAIAEHSELLVTHMVFRHAADELEGTDEDWASFLKGVGALTRRLLGRLIHEVDQTYGKNSFISSTFVNEERCRELVSLVWAAEQEGGAPPPEPAEYRSPTKRRRPNSVHILVEADLVPDGTRVNFQPVSRPEEENLSDWLAADKRRTEATWVNERAKPLLWTYDGRRYSPTGLTRHIFMLAGWEDRPVQGTSRWFVSSGESLTDLAVRALHTRDTTDL